MSSWPASFLTNTDKDTSNVMDYYKTVVEKFETSGIPIVARDDAIDSLGRPVPHLMAIYVDVDAIDGILSVNQATHLAWKPWDNDWDGIPWTPSSTNKSSTESAYDRAMAIV